MLLLDKLSRQSGKLVQIYEVSKKDREESSCAIPADMLRVACFRPLWALG